jgi:hypothetical protein
VAIKYHLSQHTKTVAIDNVATPKVMVATTPML